MKIDDEKIHPHLRARMRQRGISKKEIEITIEKGWNAGDAKKGTMGKTYVFPYRGEWEGKLFEEKEVTVYYKVMEGSMILLTAKARYGQGFKREGVQYED